VCREVGESRVYASTVSDVFFALCRIVINPSARPEKGTMRCDASDVYLEP
jgi:hypothetical protein